MKFRKTLASVSAVAVAVSSLAVSAFAAPLADKLQNDGWKDPRSYSVKSADITSDDLSAVNKVVFNMSVYDTNWGWNNGAVVVKTDADKDNWYQVSFGGSNAGSDVTFTDIGEFEVPVEFTPGPNGTFELMVTGVASDAFAVESIALYAGAELVGTYGADGYVKATTPEEPTPVDPADPAEPDKPSDVAPGTSEDVEETVDVTIKNAGKTVIDSGLVRTNIINAWAGDDACVIADKADFANAVKVKVKFTVSDFTTPFKAWLSFANNDWSVQYWGDGNDGNLNAKGTTVEVTGNGTYEVELNFDNKIAAAEFIAVCTDLAAAEGDAIPTIAIDSVKTVVDNTPATPDEPSDPTTPDEPAKPGDTTDPTEPGDSTDPVKPDDKTDPVKPDDKTDPVKPGDSTDPVKPGDSTDPAKPGDSTKPGDDNKKPSDDNKKPSNANTGVAVAVVPAAIAAAAVAAAGIVLKKRK